MNNNLLFVEFRDKYPLFIYENYNYKFVDENSLLLKFHFRIEKIADFFPTQIIRFGEGLYTQTPLSSDILSNMVFHIGMAELISYWKATCSPEVLVKPYFLSQKQQKWWKKLYFNGLGEFFYLNGIKTDIDNFMRFSFSAKKDLPGPYSLKLNDEFIIPVGGGKDSAVTLSLLGNQPGFNAGMVINQREATKGCLEASGLSGRTYHIERKIDPKLLDLNSKGFLNGHTPFSSLLAFVSALVSVISGKKHIALSNEASANEPTIPGSNINHQYSKSFEFEADFRWYLKRYISPDINYFSFLRPLNELQIAALFSRNNEKYFNVFKSCNAASKTDTWCCNCSKCLFTWIILSPFISHDQLVKIFGNDLWQKESLYPILEQLAGSTAEKPFECIGTIHEINAALQFNIQNLYKQKPLPLLLKKYQTLNIKLIPLPFSSNLLHWNKANYLGPLTKKILKNALKQLI